MKYVIIVAKSERIGVDYAFPFIFSSRVVHSMAAKGFTELLEMQYDKQTFDKYEVLSAGSIHVADDMIICIPGSESLKIAAEEAHSENGIRDTRLIHYHESTGGVML